MTIRQKLAPALLVLTMAACASSSHVIVGKTRPPIPPDQVKVYSTPPPAFEEVAILSASSDSITVGGQRSLDKVVERLKQQAAKLGANGVILEGLADSQTGSIGAGGGSDSYSRSSSVGVGAGGSLGIFKKTGKGRAIYVPAS